MQDKSIMATITLLAALMGMAGSTVTAWLFLDSRHDPAGAAVVERLRAEILIYDMAINDLTSTIANYQRNNNGADRIMELNEIRRLWALEKQQRQAEIAQRSSP